MKTHLLLAAAAATLTACGQTGDLYLPEPQQGTVVTRPPQPQPESSAPAPSGSPGTVDSPSQPTQPAPEVTAPEPADAQEPAKKKQNGATPK